MWRGNVSQKVTFIHKGRGSVAHAILEQKVSFLLIPRGPGASGWRSGNAKSVFWDVLKHQCQGYALNDAQTCIEKETYRLSEIITDSWLENPETPSLQKHSLMREEYWTEDFTLTWPGMCFTLNATKGRGMNNLIHLFLNVNLTFIVFVHDPSYFLYTYNPQAIPMTTWIG